MKAHGCVRPDRGRSQSLVLLAGHGVQFRHHIGLLLVGHVLDRVDLLLLFVELDEVVDGSQWNAHSPRIL